MLSNPLSRAGNSVWNNFQERTARRHKGIQRDNWRGGQKWAAWGHKKVAWGHKDSWGTEKEIQRDGKPEDTKRQLGDTKRQLVDLKGHIEDRKKKLVDTTKGLNSKGRKGTARGHLRTQRVTSQHYITILFMMIMKTCLCYLPTDVLSNGLLHILI